VKNHWGFQKEASSIFLKVKSGYHMGIVVNHKFTIKVISQYTGDDDLFHHGALHVEIQEKKSNHQKMIFRVIVTHLSPHDTNKRIEETSMLLNMASSSATISNVFIAGDLNTLSPSDGIFYEKTNFVRFLFFSSPAPPIFQVPFLIFY
jgi:endonuclease/exonuclease/phosphatase family metal-dependent hydrolase